MSVSNFPFINNEILRANMDEAFDHLVTLLPFTESKTYNAAAKSAFRKTIIIYTASIVEALLFYLMDQKFSESDLSEYYSIWKLQNKVELYKIDSMYQIVAGEYKKVEGDGRKEKLNLGQISIFLKDKKVLTKKNFDKVDQIRKLRNGQHIGTQTKVKEYTKSDMEKAFSVASDMKGLVQRILPS